MWKEKGGRARGGGEGGGEEGGRDGGKEEEEGGKGMAGAYLFFHLLEIFRVEIVLGADLVDGEVEGGGFEKEGVRV